ncbi:hypothetical protein M758_UG201800 [Ceratodon purpureus]|nr:hypothetical protein M758_UG201800 [Ceratodon purpureus]
MSLLHSDHYPNPGAAPKGVHLHCFGSSGSRGYCTPGRFWYNWEMRAPSGLKKESSNRSRSRPSHRETAEEDQASP